MLLSNLDLFTKIAVNIAAVFAGGWTIYTYKKSKRADATKRIFDLYNSFYTNEKYFWARDAFEHEYIDIVAPLLERRVTDRHIKLTKEEVENLRKLDLMFNFFEHLIYLEEQHILERSDREVFFEYWFDFFWYPERGGLRRYFAKCGYERLALYTKAEKNEYLALNNHQIIELQNAGKKIDLQAIQEHDRPSNFTEIEDLLEKEYMVFLVEDIKIIRELDGLLDFDPMKIGESKTVRTNYRMNASEVDCWVYI